MNSSLNHIYRVVWNASLGLWQVASEVARSGGKTQSEQRKTRRAKVGAAAVAGALASLSIPSVAFAQLPSGGQVVGGQASIVQNGNALNINQTTDRAAIDWQSFNLGQGNTVNFNQPSASSIALNRVLGSDVSVIQGAINANGQVFLVNQNGILFTPTAQVNVGGIVASTQSISTADFMAGKYTFSGNSTGTVENKGNITTSNGGTVALIAAKIINTGTITAPQGTVGLAAGNTVTLDLGGPVKIQVTQGALNTAIEQGGGIVADGGQIYLTAKAAGNLAASVINHTGVTRARTLAGNQKGEIILIADMEVGTTTVAGTLDASAPNGGDGGFIETSAANVKIQDGVNITTQSAQGHNGQWLIDPIDFTIAASGGDLTGTLLGQILNDTNLIIQTDAQQPCIVANTCGSGKEGNGDIFVNDNVTWSSPAKLTLRAHRHIVINKTITASGATGSLALEYGQGSMSGNGADYFIAADAKVNLQAGQNFSTKQGNGSSTRVFTVITALGAQGSNTGTDLQGISGNQAGNYALGADIDASATSGWESGQGFAPIFSFTGRFDGLGHKISNLTINRPNTSNGVGLFRNLSAGAVVQHLGLTNVSITGQGNAGGIAGTGNTVLIRNSYTTGSISCVNNGIFCGGILGSQAGASLQSVYSNATVNAGDTAGGLVGNLSFGTISDSYATGTITTVGGATGGLIGQMEGGTVNRSFATGRVTSSDSSVDGGFVGFYTGGTITASFWDTQTSMTNNGVGPGGNSPGSGITGRTTADMQKIATFQNAGWNITGRDGTYPMLTFSSDSVWKIGPTTSPVFIRLDCGLCESIYGETPQFSFKAFTAASGGTAVTDAMLTGTALYSLTNGGVAAGTELGRLTDAGTYAVTYTSGLTGSSMFELSAGAATNFTIKPKLLTVAIQAALGSPLSKVYDGNQNIALSANNFVISGFVDQQGVGATLGGVTSGTFNSKNVLQATTVSADIAKATLSGTAEGFKSSNYSLPTGPVTAAGTITAKGIAVSGLTAQNKTYDGNRNAVVTGTAVVDTTGVIQGDTVNVTGTVTGGLFADKDAGNDKAVSVSGLSLSGTDAGNYAIAPANLKANIAQKALTISGTTVANKDYDGNTNATVTVGTLSGVVEGETLGATTATGQFAGKDVVRNAQGAATAQNVNVAYSLANGENPAHKASNYTLAGETKTATINPKALTIAGSTVANKTYDGNTVATVTAGTLSGLVQGETLGATTAAGQFADKNAGTGKNVTVAYTLVDGVGSITAGAPIGGPGGTIGGGVPIVTPGAKASNYSLAGETLKADIAQKQVNITEFAAANKTYDGNTTATISNAGKLNGVLEGDATKVALTNTGATFDTKNAGTGKTITLNGKALTGDEAKNYVLATTPVTAQADIAQKQLTVTGFAAGNKTYDGNTTATISNAGTLNGVVQSDAGKVALTNTGATFDTKNAGTAKTVTLNGKALSGDEAQNYVLATTPVTAQADIAQKQLTIAEFAASNKVYDGNTTATIANAGKLIGVVEGDTGKVVLGNTGATFDTKNAATGKTVTLNGANITGTESANYLLAPTAVTAKADITQKTITLTGFDAANKVYDGNTAAQIVSSGSLTGVVQNDTVMVSNSGATFDTKNAGTGKTVTLNGVALSGTDAGNYSIANTATDTADITQKTITLAGFDAANKVYDGNTVAQVVSSGSLTGVVQNDTVMVSNSGATFDTKNAGTAKTVTLNGVQLSGTDAGNYSIANTATDTANIAQKQLTIAEFAASNKVYDGNTTATISNAGKLLGVVEGDTGKVLLGNTGATFDTKNAATAKTVTLNGANITGTESANYLLAPTAVTAKADITQKTITLAGFDAANKVYDGNTAAQIVSSGSLTGVVSNDTVMVSNSGATFDTKNAGTGKTVTLNGVALSGSDAGNYSIANTATDTADIAQKQLTVTGFAAGNKTYDGNTTATISNAGTLNGVVQSDAGKVTLTNTGATFDTKNAGTAKTVTLNGKTLTGDEAQNYVLATTPVTAQANIDRRALSIAGSVVANKTYDGNTTATVTAGTLSGLVQGETLGATTATGQFADKNAGTGKNVTVAYTLANGEQGQASNYSLAGETLKADIAQKRVSITEFAAANKTYDGNTTATISNAGKLNGVLEGDAAKVALTNTGATFDTKNAGTGKTVTLNGKALTGDEAKNYVLASDAVTAKADITQKAITLTGFDAANKVYDGSTVAQIVSSGSLTGVVQNDTVMVSNSGATFDTKNAGTAKTVTLNGVQLSGTDAGNYSIANTATDTANIAQKQLTIAEFAASNKVYDGNTTAIISNAGKLLGVVDGDTGKVVLGNTGATFDTKNAATGKTVTLNGANITGTESANYLLAPTAVTAKADIAKKEITLAGFDAANKVYDGNVVAQIVSSGSLTGVVQNDTVMVSNSGATFDTKNAGTGKTVTLNGVALSGSDAGNYSIANTATDMADITQKTITLAGFDAANKVYDGNTVAQIVSSGSLTGVVTNDTVMVSNSGATFDTKNAGTGKTVTLNGVALSGSDAANYSIANTATDTASITQKTITLVGFDAANKVYDGNTTATISNAGALNGVVEKDTVMVSNSGATFDNRNAGTAKTVTLNGVVLSGTDAGNYSIANTATDTADITKRGGVVLTALNKEKQLGAADPALTFEVTGLVQGDSLTGSLSRVAGETPGFYAINRGTVDNPNYEISQFTAGQLQINQSLPQETIATVNTLSSPELRPSLGERPPLDQGGVPESQAQDTPFLVTPAQVNAGGPAQVVVIEGGINLNFAGTSASGAGNNSGNTSEQQ